MVRRPEGHNRAGLRMTDGLLTDLIRRSLEKEAGRTGSSVEEVRRRRRLEADDAAEEARRRRDAEDADREERLLEALGRPDGTVARTRSGLGWVIRWTSSRYNPLRKDEVLDRILAATAAVPGNLAGASCVRSAAFSCGSFTPASTMNAGSIYELRVTGEGAFLVVDFDASGQRVYEIRRTEHTKKED